MMTKRDDKAIDDLFADVLDGAGEGQLAGEGDDPAGMSIDPSIDPSSVDSPLARGWDPYEIEVCRIAWEKLTGEDTLPDWFDEWSTVTEVARHSGKSRDEVKAAIESSWPGREAIRQRREFAVVEDCDCEACVSVRALAVPCPCDDCVEFRARLARASASPPVTYNGVVDGSSFQIGERLRDLGFQFATFAGIPPGLIGWVHSSIDAAIEAEERAARRERAESYAAAFQRMWDEFGRVGEMAEEASEALSTALQELSTDLQPEDDLSDIPGWSRLEQHIDSTDFTLDASNAYVRLTQLRDDVGPTERYTSSLPAREQWAANAVAAETHWRASMARLADWFPENLDADNDHEARCNAARAAEREEASRAEPDPSTVGNRAERRGQAPRAGHESPHGPRQQRRNR